jgi:hypothetical protein
MESAVVGQPEEILPKLALMGRRPGHPARLHPEVCSECALFCTSIFRLQLGLGLAALRAKALNSLPVIHLLALVAQAAEEEFRGAIWCEKCFSCQ